MAATRTRTAPAPAPGPGAPLDEAPARRELRRQIAYLEGRLCAYPPTAGLPRPQPRPGPGVLDFATLTAIRDDLHERLAAARAAQMANTADTQRARDRLERMLLAPGKHRFVRVSNAELGVPGCGVWHVRPRLGPLGLLMDWWVVKVSSGCPLPGPPL